MTAATTIGMVCVAFFSTNAGGPARHQHVDRPSNELGRDLGNPLELPFRVARFDDDVLALDPTALPQPFPKLISKRSIQGGKTDSPFCLYLQNGVENRYRGVAASHVVRVCQRILFPA